MRRQVTAALIVLLSSANLAAAQPPPNLIHNGDFEQGLADWAPSLNDPQGVGAAVTSDASTSRAGGRSLQISLPGPSTAAMTSPPASVQVGQDYLLSFWYRSDGFSATDA